MYVRLENLTYSSVRAFLSAVDYSLFVYLTDRIKKWLSFRVHAGFLELWEAWMPNPIQKVRVVPSPEQREQIEAIFRRHSVPAAISRRARILLLADDGHPNGRRPDHEIAVAVGLPERQIVRIRQRFVREGGAALERKPRPSVPGKLDGVAEAHLINLCCSPTREGGDR
jgi:hypothetical protein